MTTGKPKIIVVLGPTASGKSGLAVLIAKKFNGEIVSADSRQVYKGMDIGTGKVTKKEMAGIPHYLLDVASPKEIFSAQNFKTLAEKAIQEILDRGKVPIICGGTGFYIQAIVDNIYFPEVPPNKNLRKRLVHKTCEELFSILKNLDPKRAETIDQKNPHRLIRAIEIANTIGKVPPAISNPKYQSLKIGILTENKELREKIHTRLLARMKKGMVKEVETLHEKGLSWKKMEEFGLEYKNLAQFLQGKITKEKMIEKLETEIWHYAKRQHTWFKRDKNIIWFPLSEKEKIFSAIDKFLN